METRHGRDSEQPREERRVLWRHQAQAGVSPVCQQAGALGHRWTAGQGQKGMATRHAGPRRDNSEPRVKALRGGQDRGRRLGDRTCGSL